MLEDPAQFTQPKVCYEVPAPRDGFLYTMNTELCGIASVELSAGRERKEDPIDFSAGIVLAEKKIGDFVQKGQILASFTLRKRRNVGSQSRPFLQALCIQDKMPKPVPLIHARVSANGVETSE